MKYEDGQLVKCRALYPLAKATNRWQLLACRLEAFTLADMLPPVGLPVNWAEEDIAAVMRLSNIPELLLMRFAATLPAECTESCNVLRELHNGLDCRSCPIPHVGFFVYSDRVAYFWQEIYNIIGYLWSLEEEDAA